MMFVCTKVSPRTLLQGGAVFECRYDNFFIQDSYMGIQDILSI